MDNITYEKGTYQRSSFFSAAIDGDDIYQIGWNAQRSLIGVSLKKYKELKEIADGYYNVLIEKGILEKPKTQEEIIKEQQKCMNEMFNQIKIMQEEIKNLKDTPNGTIKDTLETNINQEHLLQDSSKDVEQIKEDKKNEKRLLNFK